MPKFKVLHPVLANNKVHPRGSEVILSSEDGAQLGKLGHIGPELEVATAAELNVATEALAAMTKSQLIAYATDNFDVTLSAAQTKAQMIESIVLAEEARLEAAKTADSGKAS